jgi:uncharacterized membrane protein (UPF0127 family)
LAAHDQKFCDNRTFFEAHFMKSFLNPLLAKNAPALLLTNERTGQIVASALIPAFDSASRRRGLLKHDALPEGSAILIAPTNAIHTFFMRFAIDVAFVSRDGRVVKTRVALPPWRIAAAWHAFAVVELPLGALNRAGVRSGDVLRLESR